MSKFKNDIGAHLLNALFYEMVNADKSSVLYTLKDTDHAGYPSLYRLYMEADDPTEYTFALANLDGWAHWEKLTECGWFKPLVARWRRELEIRFRARALLNIRAVAGSEGKDAYQANKFLVSGQWKESGPKRRAGQPSRDEIKSEAHRLAQISQSLDDDYDRITERVN